MANLLVKLAKKGTHLFKFSVFHLNWRLRSFDFRRWSTLRRSCVWQFFVAFIRPISLELRYHGHLLVHIIRSKRPHELRLCQLSKNKRFWKYKRLVLVVVVVVSPLPAANNYLIILSLISCRRSIGSSHLLLFFSSFWKKRSSSWIKHLFEIFCLPKTLVSSFFLQHTRIFLSFWRN